MHVLFVCTGNTCRSPLAEAILRKRLAERGRGDIEVSSAGLGATEGDPASDGAYLVAMEEGVDISEHRSRRLTPEILEAADLVLVMSRHHHEAVNDLGAGDKTWLLGEYVGRRGPEAEVADPYGLELDRFREAWAELSGMVDDLLDRLDRWRQPEQDDDRG